MMFYFDKREGQESSAKNDHRYEVCVPVAYGVESAAATLSCLNCYLFSKRYNHLKKFPNQIMPEKYRNHNRKGNQSKQKLYKMIQPF